MLVPLGDPEKSKRQVIVRSKIGTSLSEHVMSASDMIRPEQGRSVQEWYNSDWIRTRPNFQKAPAWEKLKGLAGGFLEKKKKKEQEEAEAEAPEAPVQEPLPPPQKDEEMPEAESDEGEEPAKPTLPSDCKGSGKGGRKRGRPARDAEARASKKGKSKKEQTQAAVSVADTSARGAASTRSSKAASTALSCKSGAFKATSAGSDPADVAQQQIEIMNIKKILGGAHMGHKAHLAQRKLDTWSPVQHASEITTLKAHLELARLAEKIKPESMEKIGLQELDAVLEQVIPQAIADDGDETLPVAFQKALLVARLRDVSVTTVGTVEALLDKVWPLPPAEAGAWQDPDSQRKGQWVGVGAITLSRAVQVLGDS